MERETFDFRAMFPHPAQNVFHGDDGVVHHHADDRRQAAERHRIERDAEVIEHNDRREQRQWNGGKRNKSRPQIEQEQEQHDRHQNRAQQHR